MAQVQVKFITTQKEYAVPTNAILVPVHLDQKSLSETILMLLKKPKDTPLLFDFFINQTLLQTSLETYLWNAQLSTETILTLEYSLSFPPPLPSACFQTEDWIGCVSLLSNQNQQVISGGFDGVLRLWDLTSATEQSKFHWSTLPLKCITTFTSESKSKIWVGGLKSTIYELEVDQEGTFNLTRELVGHNVSIESLLYLSKNQTLVSASFDGTIQLHKLPTLFCSSSEDTTMNVAPPLKKMKKQKLKSNSSDSSSSSTTPSLSSSGTLSGHVGSVTSLTLPQSTILVSGGGQDHTLRTWDLVTLSPFYSISTQHAVTCLTSLSQSNLVVSGHLDGFRLYDLRQQSRFPHFIQKSQPSLSSSSSPTSTSTSSTSFLRSLQFSPHSSHHLLCTGEQGVALVDLRKVDHTLHVLEATPKHRWFCSDWLPGWIVSGGDQGQLKVWKEEQNVFGLNESVSFHPVSAEK